jgi:hypothetical protein
MNFFGHAAVATDFERDPAFILGSMLPDFCSMLSARPPALHDSRLVAGVRLHHATDLVFHELETFQRLSREAHRRLLALGVGRGAARAVAHIGVELMIDDVLAERQVLQSAYISALEISRDRDVARAIAFGLDEQERFTFLMERLLERGVVANPPASLLAERLRRALAARPRLAFSADEVFLVEEWIVQAQPDVVASVPALTAALLDQLHRNMAGSPASR